LPLRIGKSPLTIIWSSCRVP